MFSFSRTSSRYHSSPSKLLSLPRRNLELIDRGLRSVKGAQHIIDLLLSRRTVTKLVLGHNPLSDDGCVHLFTFLGSPVGRQLPIAEISLNTNSIGNRGLAAISSYLIDNTTLTELFLQDNLFTSDPSTVTEFARAINQSRLRLLSLTTNRSLADDFCETFLPALRSQYLHELHLSAIGLTPRSAPYIAQYITSVDRCKLHTFKCNGNSLGLRGVRMIVTGIERANFGLTAVEMYSNRCVVSGADSEDTDNDADGETRSYNPDAWKDTEKLLKQVLGRNTHLMKQTKREALHLLVYSRAVLFDTKHPSEYADSIISVARTYTTGFEFKRLPIEIQLHILSFLSPTLSSSQRARIFDYASSTSTLPPLLPSMPGLSPRHTEPAVFSMCVPEPSITMASSRSVPVWAINNSGEAGCAPGKCMGRKSLLCNLDHHRNLWLEQVGCLAYDPRTEGG
ncbi:hypothetical protein F5878DRAFT_571997 [Lentinula raphanica]|uniref:RNI-like protein n=1 Tax=Lentinula raphanica TaxID=153919 RepID=A0AA38PM21_9AGAR|nr:hypothetical protein F5878DRAFT_571997 [Lentinula raphanica]